MTRIERAGTLAGAVISVLLLVAAWRHWVAFELVEALGFVSGGWCVWLGVKQNIWNWPIGIANNVFYIVVFLQARLFADMSLQVAFAAVGAYGWFAWLRRDDHDARLSVSGTPLSAWIVCAVAVAAVTTILAPYLASHNDAAPFLDALTTTLSLAAMYLMTRKYVECWLVWISIDVISIGLYAYKGLALTAVLYAIYLAMCVVGFREWKAILAPQRLATARA